LYILAASAVKPELKLSHQPVIILVLKLKGSEKMSLSKREEKIFQ
jgi:hypothetical protein